MHYKRTNKRKDMYDNYLPKPYFVKRSDKPIYNGKFALTTDVTRLARFDSFVDLMINASKSAPNSWWLQYHTKTNNPRDTVRVIPSVLNSFNRSRILRRSRVSGLRMCNLYERNLRYFYISDLVVTCSFDAVAIASGIAELDKLGDRVFVYLPFPPRLKRCKVDFNKAVDAYSEKFWRSSKLARHSVYLTTGDWERDDTICLIFEPKTLHLLPLLGYILNAFSDRLCWLSVGNNQRLMISRNDMVDDSLYQTYKPTQLSAKVRYKHFSAFGTFFNNPNYIF